jgi:ubiquinone/menaquinone biosynthesis C-methylase UbiE
MVNVKKIIMRNFSQSTGRYEEFEEKYGFFKSLAREMMNFGGVESGVFLDAGCGTGIMKDVAPNLELVGMDVSPEMVRIAIRKIEKALVGDAENLPFRDKVFDGVLFNASIFLIPDAKKAVRESIRVSKDGGVILGSYLVGFYEGEEKIVERYGLRHREVYPSEKIDRFVDEFGAEVLSVHYQVNGEFMKDFYFVPAMSNALFPKMAYEERVKKINEIFSDLPEKIEFRCRIFKITV